MVMDGECLSIHSAVLDLIKMCLVLEYKDDPKHKHLNNWKSHCGGGC